MGLNIKDFIKKDNSMYYKKEFCLHISCVEKFLDIVKLNIIKIIINNLNTDDDIKNFYLNNEDIINKSEIIFYTTNNNINFKKYNFNIFDCNDNKFKDFIFMIDYNPNLKITYDDIINLKKYFFNYKLFIKNKIFHLSSLNKEYLKQYAIQEADDNNKNKDIFLSIVTVVTNISQYKHFLYYLKRQIIIEDYIELIPIFNYKNNYKNISEPLNYGIDISSGKYIILCHQDIIFYNLSWFQKIKNILNLLPSMWGVLGMAGIDLQKRPILYLNNENRYNFFYKKYGYYKEVQTLDELCLIIKNQKKENKQLYFDEDCINDFHFYGLDLCLQSITNGYKNYAICAECFHLSDGTSNLLSQESYKRFCDSAIKVYKKWIDKFSEIYTTTTYMNKEERKIIFTIIRDYKKINTSCILPEQIILDE